MSAPTLQPSGIERTFGEDEIIVSKTDLKGHITYANQIFLRVSGYSEQELLGRPHNIIRHPDMPRCVFKLLWDTLVAEREIFAYVLNMSKNGDHYWVFAHVTPTYDNQRKPVGYHSNRRCPSKASVAAVEPLYRALLEEEQKFSNKQQGIEASTALLQDVLRQKHLEYDELAFAI
jgi:PAS domain S-box-containing protein